MIGALVGAGLSAVGSVAGGIAGRRAARKARKELNRQKRENENWYNRRYNEDATQRADAQRLLQITEDNIKRRNKAAEGAQAVIGGTEASVAATKEANNAALSNAVGQITAAGEARKDAIEADYRSRKAELANQQVGMEQQKAANVAAATKGVLGAAGSIAGALDGGLQPKTRSTNQPQTLSHGLSSSNAKDLLDEANKQQRDYLNSLTI